MNMSNNTLIALEEALQRIVDGEPKRITKDRKLSARAVEEEANLGNGSSYYYPELIEKVKQEKEKIVSRKNELVRPDIDKLRDELNDQKRIKNDYREKNTSLINTIKQISASQHHLSDALRKALTKINELEIENAELREELAKEKRSKVTSIK